MSTTAPNWPFGREAVRAQRPFVAWPGTTLAPAEPFPVATRNAIWAPGAKHPVFFATTAQARISLRCRPWPYTCYPPKIDIEPDCGEFIA